MGRRVALAAADSGLIALLLLVFFVAYGSIDNRWYRVVTIDGQSMEPTIPVGSLAVITPVNSLEPGMIVTMQVDGNIVTHRVVSVDPLVTKGDANRYPDEFTRRTVHVIGRYRFAIPFVGWLSALGPH